MGEQPEAPASWRADVDAKLASLADSMDANTKITTEVKEILDALRGAIRVMGWIGRIAKWVTPLVVLGTALLALFHQIKTGKAS